jgi:hypothetical protein
MRKSTEADTGGTNLISCSNVTQTDTSYCCDHTNNCCDTGVGRFIIQPSQPQTWATFNTASTAYVVVGVMYTSSSTLTPSQPASTTAGATTSSTPPSSTSSSASGSGSSGSGSSSTLKIGLGVGIGLGVVVIALAIALAVLLCRRRRRSSPDTASQGMAVTPMAAGMDPGAAGSYPQQHPFLAEQHYQKAELPEHPYNQTRRQELPG